MEDMLFWVSVSIAQPLSDACMCALYLHTDSDLSSDWSAGHCYISWLHCVLCGLVPEKKAGDEEPWCAAATRDYFS